MVEKNASGTYSEVEYSPLGKVAVMNGRTQLQGYVPLPGGEIMSPNPDSFWHVDWLGSVRLASSASQRTITFDRAFAPFGETYNTVTGGTSNPEFAGLTQDTASGEYDAAFRQYHPSQSRWISPDPAGLSAVDAGNPQSWNRYAYVMNNPLIFTDPSGLDPCNDGGPDPWASDMGGGGTYNGGFSYMPDGGCLSDSQAYQRFEAQQQIFDGENSINFPMGSGNVWTDLWQDALGLPSVPCQSQFGPWCDPSMLPNPWILDAQKGDPELAINIWNCPDGKGHDPCAQIWQQAQSVVGCTAGAILTGPVKGGAQTAAWNGTQAAYEGASAVRVVKTAGSAVKTAGPASLFWSWVGGWYNGMTALFSSKPVTCGDGM